VAQAALAAHPDDGDLRFLVACGAEARGEWADAAQAFALAAEGMPEDPEPLLRRGRALRLLGRGAEALAGLEAAVGRFREHAPVHAALGYAAIDVRDPERAVRAFEEAVRLDPDWPVYQDDLAGALMLCERWRDALKAAVQSLERRKRNERAWTVYAISHARLGDEERAEQGYRNAVRAAKEPTRAQGNYGLFLSRRPDRVLEAARLLRAAAEAHPDWTEVRQRLDGLTRQD
jgi:tetratricopeptide (TPR) repeat protein